uniref:COPI associated protein n=1 Tax=Chrysotila carterae TaxID=13221 RepID=A0A7S4B8S3_CHRCT|mmetsp:Transcript_29458/g.56954  ORF Transcript_29458/g.56954 Transcript_29458/m.56954 type:complete len:224 (+) Transcript_29458:132-803(+)
MPSDGATRDKKESCWYKVNYIKRFLAVGCGIAICVSAVFTLLNLTNILDVFGNIRMLWNVLFGILIVLLNLQWYKTISKRFGFLEHWFGRGMFYLFVGTMAFADEIWWSYIVGLCTIGVGVLELLFGSRCVDGGEEPRQMPDASEDNNGKNGFFNIFSGGAKHQGTPVQPTGQASNNEPSFTVTVNPSQISQAASAVSSVSMGATSSNKPTTENPFFGNAHLN